MNITPELLAALGYTRGKLGRWYLRDLDFDCTLSEYDDIDGTMKYAFGARGVFISEVAQLFDCIFAAGIEEGQKRSADDFRRLIGLRGEG